MTRCFVTLPPQGIFEGMYIRLPTLAPDFQTIELWWQGELPLDLNLAPASREGPCLVVASN